MKLDALDQKILDVLRRNARLSSRAIGREIGVAAGTVSQRIAKLEEAGVITGYSVVLDPERVGHSLGFVIGLQMNQGNEMMLAMEELVRIAEIEEVFVVTGRWDLLVIGRVADPAELNALLTRGLWQSPSFRHSETMLGIDRGSTHAMRAAAAGLSSAAGA